MSELLCANVREKKWLSGLLDGLSLGDGDNALSLGDDDKLALLCRHLRRPKLRGRSACRPACIALSSSHKASRSATMAESTLEKLTTAECSLEELIRKAH
jgi:hypothetical protein